MYFGENILNSISNADRSRIITKATDLVPEGCTFKELIHVDLGRAYFFFTRTEDGDFTDILCSMNSDILEE